MENNKERVIIKEKYRLEYNNVRILVDTKTGVNYLSVFTGAGVSVTPLLDENGHVIVDK